MPSQPTTRTPVLIAGSGSAGLSAATWLARYGIPCTTLERRSGPLKMGQADGVQCRTVEIFESFGLGEELLREAYHVLEVVFWAEAEDADAYASGASTGNQNQGGNGSGKGRITRSGRAVDTQPGLSHAPHVILNQARINGLMLEAMGRFSGGAQGIEYGWDVKGVEVKNDDGDEYPVKVTAESVGDGEVKVFEAKYVLACDGAHSTVRKALGYNMIGDSTDAVWGVMDMVPRTDFPDIRKKASIRSKAGNLLIIPREGENDNLTRFYIELPGGTNAKDVKLEDLQQAAKSILSQYEIGFTETVWWSAYAIGQRHADFFHKDYRVFLAGDACHTHSPKAGQGMNVSLQDGYNIGWKLAHVLKGLAPPSLLETYVLERQKVAIDLINFDRYFSKLFSTKGNASPAEFQEGFVKAGKYTAGLTAKYDQSPITTDLGLSDSLAKNVVVGMRLPSSQVVRYCDSKPVQLATSLKSDGCWRVMVFPGDISVAQNKSRLDAVGAYLDSSESPLQRFRLDDGDVDSLIEPILVGHGPRHNIELDQIPPAFYPITGKNKIRDLHKIFFDDESYNQVHGHLYDHLGISSKYGAIMIVRPDQCKNLMNSYFLKVLLIVPFNYTVAPHLQHFAVPFPTFRAANPQYTCYVGGGLIFSRTASATDQDQNHKERGGKGDPPLRILLLQRSYEDSYGGQWEGPGGSCDPEDETLLDGVAREILEESGLHVSRFVELAGKDEWVRQRPGQIIVAAKFTFIVEVHEAKAAVPGLGVQEEEKEDGLPAAKLDDGTVVPALERRWEDLVKLDPAEHRAFEWVTEEEVKEAENDSSGKFKSFANQGRTMLEGFRILREASGVGGDA
ncbi:FAD binding domain-containing protein [Aspergillus undulatus]|uniref:FAD binding domain-containing protein n=1 Tax=Aspergillus undulatus TaxID=1810928 RepID=UPI003CCC996B